MRPPEPKSSADTNFEAAMSLYTGSGGRYDTAKAFKLFSNGAKRGHMPSDMMCRIMRCQAHPGSAPESTGPLDPNEVGGIHGGWITGKAMDLGIARVEGVSSRSLFVESMRQGSCLALYESYMSGRNGRNLDLLRRSASIGYPPAIHELARVHELGLDGVPQSSDDAMELYIRSADRGYVPSMAGAASLRLRGMDSGRLDVDVVGYLSSAADMGHTGAQLMLGHVFQYGIGTSPDYSAAMYWYLCASDGGSVHAPACLGMMYEFWEDEEAASGMAYHFYSIGADRGDPLAKYRLAMMEHRADEPFKPLRSEVALIGEASESGLPAAMCQMALCYENGQGVPRSHERAVSLMAHAAETGDLRSMYHLSRLYMSTGSDRKVRAAVRLCRAAADQAYPEAERMMGDLCRDGVAEGDADSWYARAEMHGL